MVNVVYYKTMSAGKEKYGSMHPVSVLMQEIVSVFQKFGYKIASGPELETAYYNFEALNIPKGHPAQEMWDTFWIKGQKEKLLRTHTSPVQVRYMEKHKPPIRVIVPGKVFRNEATDTTHEVQFHQVEGLCISKNTTLAQMKGVLNTLLQELFGDKVQIRYRPSFFPFTEPSLEVDMKRESDEKWIEILGCGMVHRQVLTRVGIDPQNHRGFAFGMGVDRIAMLRHGFDDIRMLYKGDLQLVMQF